MKTIRIFAILAVGGLLALGASARADRGAAVDGDPSIWESGEAPTYDADLLMDGPPPVEIDDSVTLIEPYEGFGVVTLEELAAALAAPAGAEPWELGELTRWEGAPDEADYPEPIRLVDALDAVVGIIDLPEPPQDDIALADEPILPTWPQPVAETGRTLDAAGTGAGGYGPQRPGAVYATTAEHVCQTPLQSPVYHASYYYYPYSGAYGPLVLPIRTRRLWPPVPWYAIYPRWREDFALRQPPSGWWNYNPYRDPYWIATSPYFGLGLTTGYVYGGLYSYPSYFGTYVSYPYHSYSYVHPYAGYYGRYSNSPYYFGSGLSLSFSYVGDNWSIYAQLGLPAHWHVRDRHRPLRSALRSGTTVVLRSSSAAGAPPIRPWRPGVSRRIADARGAAGRELSTGRSLAARQRPAEVNRRVLSAAALTGQAQDGALVGPRRASTSAKATRTVRAIPRMSPPTVAGSTAAQRLKQRRQAYMSALRSGPATSQAILPNRSLSTASRFVGPTRSASTSSPTAAAAPAVTAPTRRANAFRPQVAPARSGSALDTARSSSLTSQILTPTARTARSAARTVGPQRAASAVSAIPSVRTSGDGANFPSRRQSVRVSSWPHGTATTRTTSPSGAVPTRTRTRIYIPRTAASSALTPRIIPPAGTATRVTTPTRAATGQAAPTSPAPRSVVPRVTAPTYTRPTTTPRPTGTRTIRSSALTPSVSTKSPTRSVPTRSIAPSTSSRTIFTPRSSVPSRNPASRSLRSSAVLSPMPSVSRSTVRVGPSRSPAVRSPSSSIRRRK